jgi:lactate dehydrogenase-like 2-hydroxyacid dehydrogenase
MADILLMRPVHATILARLEREATVHHLYAATDRAALLRETGSRVQAMIASGSVDAAMMDTMPGLRLIAVSGVGYDNVDTAAATARGIIVTNTPDVLTHTVADLALALILAVERRIVAADAFMRRGDWKHGAFPLARDVRGLTLGILGLGRIGIAIAQRAETFGLRVQYSNRRQRSDVGYPYHEDALALAHASDILLAVVPGGAETRHLVTEEVLRALGPEGTLVNIARGSVVDEAALVRCLLDGSLGTAALDVFDREPEVPAELFALDNVVLTPHIGSATHTTREAMANLAADNVLASLAGSPPLTPVVESAALVRSL